MHQQDETSPGGSPERLVDGRYRLLSVLGEGGMGVVWRAHDEVLHREVAVKEVRAPAGLPAAQAGRLYARLEREAWAAARVAAGNVVTVHDVVTDGGRPWIVMELVRGRSLADLLRTRGRLEPREAARIGAEVLAALRAVHGAGVLHRDVKPANVLLADDGRAVLSDFGIARMEGTAGLTMAGEVVGSPEYIAPEQALGRAPGAEADLWSLGVLLHTAVQGRSPFRKDDALATLRAVVDEEPPPPHLAGPLTPVIGTLLRKDPAERATAEQTARDLRLIAAGGVPGTDTAPTAPALTPADEPDTGPHLTATATAMATAPATVTDAATLTGAAAAPTSDAHPGTEPTAPRPPAPDVTVTSTAAAPQPAPPSTPPTRPATRRRTRQLLTVAAALCVLLAAGLGYAATRSTGGDGPGAGAATGQPVAVTVSGTHTTYAGACPPPPEQAPAFTATFTVTEPPVRFAYRWVSVGGAVVDPSWRTLSFPAGGPRTHQETVRLTAYAKEGRLSSAMAVEIRTSPQTVSGAVPFTLTCEPSADGAS
ncbi:protein kinase [Streptomyces sp. Tu 6176]|uniref:serine/threonine-protein kinase n=1 Tax=Streptomyces sp. Tu 6176 TaxID=1470557 RepID=UPI00045396A9|nr:serine/threonine-protein kinase [Streptomyces sp. Tu 6176]EYT81642.1 protein kinase [Streptomyces sp. Tu 6176]